jgi:hypothetical protein
MEDQAPAASLHEGEVPELESQLTAGQTLENGGRSNWASAIHTGDSLDGMSKPKTVTPQHTAKIIEGLLKVIIVVAEHVLQGTGRKLRRPTETQLQEIATPTAALLVRHTPLAYAPESLVDLTSLAAAVSDYALDGPLATRTDAVQHVGMPTQTDVEEALPVTAVPASAVTYLQ